MKVKERGYYTLEASDGAIQARLGSRTYISQLKKHTGKDLVTFGSYIQSLKDEDGIFNAIADIVYSGMLAYNLEEKIEQDYNIHTLRNELWDAMQKDSNVAAEIFETLTAGLPKSKEVQGKKKS